LTPVMGLQQLPPQIIRICSRHVSSCRGLSPYPLYTIRQNALAFLLEYQTIVTWLGRHGNALFWLCSPALIWEIYRYQSLIPLTESMLIALMIGCTSLNPASLPAKALEWRHLEFTGRLSYSFYLWQQVFLRNVFGTYGLLLLGVAAIVSWKFIEQPCIQFGRRLENRHSTPTLHPAGR